MNQQKYWQILLFFFFQRKFCYSIIMFFTYLSQKMNFKSYFGFATLTFLMLTLLSLVEDNFPLMAYRIVLVAYSATMITVEIKQNELVQNETALTKIGRAISVLGYATFIEAAYLYHSLNQGNMYIIASFLITTATLLKILNLAMESLINKKRVFKNPYNILRISAMAGVGLCFFITSVSDGLKQYFFYSTLLLIAKGSNTLAAGSHIMAMFYLHKEQQMKQVQKIRFTDSNGELL